MEWIEFKNIVNIIPGYAIPSSDMKEEGTPIIKITNIRDDGSLDLDNTSKYCKPITSKLRKFILKDKDVVVCMTGATIGKVAQILKADRNYLVNQRVCIIRAKNPKLQDYIYQILSLPSFRKYVEIVGYGAAQPNISATSIAKFKFFANNSITIQQKIASILSAYDSLIENNTKRICLLEQMAENLYKEWFVRFRFPGHENTKFVDGLPKGWSVKKYGEIAEIVAGGDCPFICSDIPTENLCVPIYSNGVTNEGLYGYTNKERISKPCITISARGTIGYVCLRTIPFVPIVRLLAVVPKNISVYYLFHYSRYNYLEGNGTSQQQLTKPMLQKRKIFVPAKSTLLKFDMIVENIYNQKRKLEKQNSTLAHQRDLLLPRLMSGKLEVKA